MARFLRAAVLLLLAGGALGCVFTGQTVLKEFHARHHWPIAQGEVVSCEQKNGRGASSRSRRRYWMECEVRFAVPIDQCLTGTIASDKQAPYPCFGTIRSRSTTSWNDTNGWNQSEFLSTPKRIFHNPDGPDVKLADEPPWLAYPWPSILALSGWMLFFGTLLAIIQWRLIAIEKSVSV